MNPDEMEDREARRSLYWALAILGGVIALWLWVPTAFAARHRDEPTMCNLSDCAKGSPLLMPGPCPTKFDGLGNPWQLNIGGEPYCPAGAIGLGVTNPDTTDRVPLFDSQVPCEYVARLCPVPIGEP